MPLHIFDSVDAVLKNIADFFVEQAKTNIERHGKFTVALSGGSSPQKLYALLASEYKNKIDWSRVYFFFGDERFVPHTDVQSNYKMAKETLFEPLGISADHIFPVNTSVTPEASANQYEKAVREQLGTSVSFDLILLGLGDNSHTASLFPHTSVLHEREAFVKEVFVEEVNQFRITLTAPLINNAKSIAFLVYGTGKAEAVHHILKDPYQPEEFPAQLIKPVSGEAQWFMDQAAASAINAK